MFRSGWDIRTTHSIFDYVHMAGEEKMDAKSTKASSFSPRYLEKGG
jgi:hypothetical protein